MSTNNHREVIRLLLESADLDFRQIVYRIAVSNPKAVVDAISWKEKAQEADLERRCAEMIKSFRKLEAIKLWRAETKATLKDAKEAIDRIESNHQNGSTTKA